MKNTTRIIWPIAVLLVGVGVVAGLVTSKKRAKQIKPKRLAPAVEVLKVSAGNYPTQIRARGTLVAAKQVELKAEVTGRVVSQHAQLVPGGVVKKGEVLVRVDDQNYQIALQQRQASLEKAKFDLALEKGRQRVAQKEWDLLGKKDADADEELALRKPQLKAAEANLAAAQSQVRRARLDLSRARVKAPFNAFVKNEQVDVGAIVGAQAPVATLVGTDEFWAQVSVPVNQLSWLPLPDSSGKGGAEARVAQHLDQGKSIERAGKIVRLMGELDPKGRMARILVGVKDPLGLTLSEDAVPLLLGAYVDVKLSGKDVEGVYALPRAALRDGNKLWVADAKNRLRILDAEVKWRSAELIYIAATHGPSLRVITSRLDVPAEKTELRVVENKKD